MNQVTLLTPGSLAESTNFTPFPVEIPEQSIQRARIAKPDLRQMPFGFDNLNNLATFRQIPDVKQTINVRIVSEVKQALDKEIYDILSDAKIKTRLIGNHIPRDWQVRLFRQLDQLHDLDAWELGDRPMRAESFDTFLSVILSLRPSVRPGLGLSHKGYLQGTWGKQDDRITLDFLPNARLRWTIAATSDRQVVRFAGEAPMSEFEKYLAPFHPDHWWHKSAKR